MPDAKTKKCFVVGPIGPADSEVRIHSDWLLNGIIEPVFREHFPEFQVTRADKIASPGMIDSQIINHLLDDDLVIADLTTLNPNAFYEIGIRHMIEKPIIHMFLETTEIPFDVKPYRAISFCTTRHSDIEDAKASLLAAAREVMSPEFKVENPVTRARGTLQIRNSATPEMQIILERLDEHQAAISRLMSQNVFNTTPVNPLLSGFNISFNKGTVSEQDISEILYRNGVRSYAQMQPGVFEAIVSAEHFQNLMIDLKNAEVLNIKVARP